MKRKGWSPERRLATDAKTEAAAALQCGDEKRQEALFSIFIRDFARRLAEAKKLIEEAQIDKPADWPDRALIWLRRESEAKYASELSDSAAIGGESTTNRRKRTRAEASKRLTPTK